MFIVCFSCMCMFIYLKVNQDFWLGGIYNTSMNPLQWVDYVTFEPLTFLPWDTDQPNMGAGEIYLGHYLDQPTGFHDFIGNEPLNYMCQIHL